MCVCTHKVLMRHTAAVVWLCRDRPAVQREAGTARELQETGDASEEPQNGKHFTIHLHVHVHNLYVCTCTM